ncbi:MAG: maltooligosyl trehalose synthase [Devosia sp.]|uniref:malto-oligosyltrehalose synthase n=1 Tax=Devosia sp. TaxID=1871048 RepID=UPI00262C7089|nr:malto-oligosyltrehalose synthase [Devosia sp.]MDB5538496.1 maltooligosyl trehalose synthase [Devosia sp.]
MNEQTRPIPRATYRLQLNKDFTFNDVAGLASYLGALGVSHAYLSPILKARPGSTHGYDTVDHTMLNPELGTLAEFRQMARALKAEGLSVILDIVPNHMGIGGDQNPLWLDVLEWGERSRYAEWFDINWSPRERSLAGKVLVPLLSTSFGQALSEGGFELKFDADKGSFDVWAESSHRLPVSPISFGRILGRAGGALAHLGDEFAALCDEAPRRALELKRKLAELVRDCPAARADLDRAVAHFGKAGGNADLRKLIVRQHWRPAHSSVAADDINYRRFFIVSDLVGIRVERDEVFDHVHKLTFDLIDEGLVDGLRVDHIDGLYDPKAYCLKLRQRAPRPIYLIVEKILAPHETLRADWNVDGTTGYEFAAAATRLLVDAAGENDLDEIYRTFTGATASPETVEREAKLAIIDYEMPAELDSLCDRLHALASADPATVDITRNGIRNGLRRLVANMPVYRTYVDGGELGESDRRNIGVAMAMARRSVPALQPQVFDFLEAVMTGEALCNRPDMRGAVRDAAMRIQQYTGPVMAKGLEDTALYRFNRLIAVSDVGSKPGRLSQGVPSFHEFNTARQAALPAGMLGTSSHDSKRGEDVRARVAAISGLAEAWGSKVAEWRASLGQGGAPEIEPNHLYYFFQTLLGAWPVEFDGERSLGKGALEPFRERLTAAMLKSVKESRVRTSWTIPEEGYERQVEQLIGVALSPTSPFLASFREFESRAGLAGAKNGIVEAVLKLTVPGVSDIYQGAELWEQSMVDPDNRRPVDYARRQALLRETETLPDLSTLLPRWRDGAIKIGILSRLLQLRRAAPDLFLWGSYEVLPMEGPDDRRTIGFMRQHGEEAMIVLCGLGSWLGAHDAYVTIPKERRWRDALRSRDVAGGRTPMAELFGELPAAVLVATL